MGCYIWWFFFFYVVTNLKTFCVLYLSTAREGKGLFTPSVKVNADNSAMTLAKQLLLKTMESLQNGAATHFQATPLFSMRTVFLVSLQNCCSIHADAWCEWALMFSQAFVILLAHSYSVTAHSCYSAVGTHPTGSYGVFILGGCETGAWKNVF